MKSLVSLVKTFSNRIQKIRQHVKWLSFFSKFAKFNSCKMCEVGFFAKINSFEN